MAESLKTLIKNQKMTLAVYGLGNVGGPIAAAWLRKGAKVIGVDISDYVETAGPTDELADINTAISEVGLDPDGPRGLEIKAAYSTPGPRTRTTILKEGLDTPQSRNKMRQSLGNAEPTWIVTEDMIQELDDAEITAWVIEIDKIGAQVVHISHGSPKDATALNALTGHKIIDYGSSPYEVVG